MPPSNPLRLQVADRMVTVLSAIEAGDNFFFTPYKVAKKLLPYEDAKHGPLYMPLPVAGGAIDTESDHIYWETFRIGIHGVVFDRVDLGTAIEKAIRDVRLAIDVDSRNSVDAGSLSKLAIQVRIDDPPDIEYFGDFVFFEQPVRVQISGNFGAL